MIPPTWRACSRCPAVRVAVPRPPPATWPTRTSGCRCAGKACDMSLPTPARPRRPWLRSTRSLTGPTPPATRWLPSPTPTASSSSPIYRTPRRGMWPAAGYCPTLRRCWPGGSASSPMWWWRRPTDRLGAELLAVMPTGPDREVRVEGEELHVTRSASGGWSQRRFQQRAENRWQQNAGAVAEALTRLVDQCTLGSWS